MSPAQRAALLSDLLRANTDQRRRIRGRLDGRPLPPMDSRWQLEIRGLGHGGREQSETWLLDAPAKAVRTVGDVAGVGE